MKARGLIDPEDLTIFNTIKIFDEFPVVDDIVLTYRNYKWIFPYVRYLLTAAKETRGEEFCIFLDRFGMPGAEDFLERIIENSKDGEFKEIAKRNLDLSYIWDDIKKIKTRKKFFVESALGSLQQKINSSRPLTVQLFEMELVRLGWNLKDATEEELKNKFKVLLYPHTNFDGTPHSVIQANLSALIELINLAKTQT